MPVEGQRPPLRALAAAAASGALRAALGVTARDATDETSRRSCLVLAPHPDDETLGCGLSILNRRARGTPVTIAVLTDGAGNPPGEDVRELARRRRGELEGAASRLGVSPADLRWLGFPDGRLEEHHREAVVAVEALLDALDPDDVLVTSVTDPHPDHATLALVAREAAAGRRARLLEYPIWQWHYPRRLGALLGHRPLAVDGGPWRRQKLAAIACYRSQLDSPARGGLPASIRRACSGRRELFFPPSRGRKTG